MLSREIMQHEVTDSVVNNNRNTVLVKGVVNFWLKTEYMYKELA